MLATRLGDQGTRRLYVVLTVVVAACVVAEGALTTWWALLGLAGVAMLGVAVRAVVGGATGRALIKVLALTGMAELVLSGGLALGWLIG